MTPDEYLLLDDPERCEAVSNIVRQLLGDTAEEVTHQKCDDGRSYIVHIHFDDFIYLGIHTIKTEMLLSRNGQYEDLNYLDFKTIEDAIDDGLFCALYLIDRQLTGRIYSYFKVLQSGTTFKTVRMMDDEVRKCLSGRMHIKKALAHLRSALP